MEIRRASYLDRLKQLDKANVIKTLVGMRRVGKSTILKQFAKKIWAGKCLCINKEESEFEQIAAWADLIAYVDKHIKGKTHVFIDEIQYIAWWTNAILWLYAAYKNVSFIITWSNSEIFSSQLATQLRGRTFQIDVLPFSYAEYCAYFHTSKNAKSFDKYLKIGGMPSIYQFPETYHKERTKTLINTVFLKDIVQKFAIRDVSILEDVLLFIINNVGNFTNANSITSYFKSKHVSINHNTIQTYINYLESSLLISGVDRYDLQGKRILAREKKYYWADHGIRYHLFSGYDDNQGKALENYIYVHSKRAGYTVFVWKIRDKEVDFVLEKNGKKIYVQVAYILTDQDVIEREFKSLEEIHDSRPKYVVTLDPVTIGIRNGIKHIQAREREDELAKNM